LHLAQQRIIITSTFSHPEANMHKTRNDIPLKTRTKLVEMLNKHLANSIDLESQLKQAHWNIRGPDFIALHELLDKIHGKAEEYVDMIAERATALGGTAHGTVRMVAKNSALAEYPKNATKQEIHLKHVADILADFGKRCRAAIEEADDMEDKVTADLFTEIVRENDQQLWFIEAHFQ
jgi:starvation-inducible DNA-binding protein